MEHNSSDTTFSLRANEQLLQELAKEKFVFASSPGNAGDAAIACATFQSFDAFGCDYRAISIHCEESATHNQVVVFGGGGNLVPYYQDAYDFLRRHHRRAKRVVILPHTVRGHEDLLASFGPNVTIYCRDLVSLTHVRAAAKAAEVRFAHDMALMLQVDQTLRWRLDFQRREFMPGRLYCQRIRPHLAAGAYRRQNSDNPDRLLAFREDVERTKLEIPLPNLDVSNAFGKSKGSSLAEARAVTRKLLCFLRRYPQVHTNRLHVSILAALMGGRVYLHDNTYGKNRDVYEASLKARFPNMRFVDEIIASVPLDQATAA